MNFNHMDAEWRGYSAAAVGGYPALQRGAPVLKWAAERLRADKALVAYLVWSNPSNLCFASPALQADADVVAAALASPFYAEPPPPVPPSCVLRFAAEELRASREVVLAALARSAYELEFASEALRADAHLVAWAGAPVGSFGSRELSNTFMRLLKSGCSVQHMDENWKLVLHDKDCVAATKPINNVFNPLQEAWSLVQKWPELLPERPKPSFDRYGREQPVDYRTNVATKPGLCDSIKQAFAARCPLCLRVAPPVREVLWPTREEWDGVF